MSAKKFRRALVKLVDSFAEKGGDDPNLAHDLDAATYIIHFSLWREGGQSKGQMMKALTAPRTWHKRKGFISFT
jgi:hypothetical protein